MSSEKGILSHFKTGILLGVLVGAIVIGCAWFFSSSPQDTQNGVAIGDNFDPSLPLDQKASSDTGFTGFFVAGGAVLIVLLGSIFLFIKRRRISSENEERRSQQAAPDIGTSLEEDSPYRPRASRSVQVERPSVQEQRASRSVQAERAPVQEERASRPVQVERPSVQEQRASRSVQVERPSVQEQRASRSVQVERPSGQEQRASSAVQAKSIAREQRASHSAQLGCDEAAFLRGVKALYIRASSAWAQKNLDAMLQYSTGAGFIALRTEIRRPWRSRCKIVQDMTVKLSSINQERVKVCFEGVLREQMGKGSSCEVKEEWAFVRQENSWKIDTINVHKAECL